MTIETNPDGLKIKAKGFSLKGLLHAVGQSPLSHPLNVRSGTVGLGNTVTLDNGTQVKITPDGDTPPLGEKAFIHLQGDDTPSGDL
jgi:hypothetical protein